ncbi:UNVERIFIED_CONTAM: hypothetical protein PYX00_009972 [Menopon gallinae]|uniref:PID domain-containing protein n=1 Tax=Menopon gallinae TaxID=328185 RepID=A0AAW2HD59_9NEOP
MTLFRYWGRRMHLVRDGHLAGRTPAVVPHGVTSQSIRFRGNEMTGKDSDDGIAIREKDLPQKFVLKVLGHCETTGLWGLKHTREPVEKMVKFAKDHKLCLPIVQLIATREGIFVLPLDRKRNPDAEESRVKIDVTIPRTEIKCVKVEKGETDDSKVGKCFRIKAHFRIVKRIDRGRSKVKKKMEEIFPERKESEICKGCGREQHEKPTRATTDVELLEKYKKIDWKRNGILFYPIDNISYGVQDLVYTRVFSMIEVTDASNRFGPARVPFVCHSFVCESHNTAKMLTYALDAAFQAYGKTLKDMRSQ